MSFPALKGHPRLTPVRADLAAFWLKDQISAPRYSKGVTLRVGVPLAGMSDAPDPKSEMINHVLWGETFTVYDVADGWAWGQAADGYVGYVRASALRENAPEPTHRVATVQCLIRPEANVRARPVAALPYGALATVIEPGEAFCRVEGGGLVPAPQLRPLGQPAPDWVAEAEGFRGAPYMWGGRSHVGVDCSGLIQIAMQAAELECPRDADMQESALGEAVPADQPLRRGDLVFWKGHVGVMTDAQTLFHANAHHMAAAHEPLEAARARILAAGGGETTAVKRLG